MWQLTFVIFEYKQYTLEVAGHRSVSLGVQHLKLQARLKFVFQEQERTKSLELDNILKANEQKMEEQRRKLSEDRLRLLEDQMKVENDKRKLLKKVAKAEKAEILPGFGQQFSYCEVPDKIFGPKYYFLSILKKRLGEQRQAFFFKTSQSVI